MPLSDVVGNVAGLVSWNSFCSAFAFRLHVMEVQISRTYATTTEVASHKRSFLCVEFGFVRTAFRLENWQEIKRRSDLPQEANSYAFIGEVLLVTIVECSKILRIALRI
jgi:hypothetical protein